MPRPSKKEERSEEILIAYEKCVAKYGVAGATLQKVSDEAQIARALLRHNIGNSDVLLEKAVARYCARSIEVFESHFEHLSKRGATLEDFVEGLFEKKTNLNEVMIASAFIISAQESSFVREKMHNWFKKVRKLFLDYFSSKCISNVSQENIRAVADGIIALYFNQESLTPLGSFTGFRKSSLLSAKLLLKQLQ